MPGGPLPQHGAAGVYQWDTRSDIKTLAAVCSGWGLTLILSGPQRFTSPAWSSARLVPGQHLTWGGLFITAGLLTWAGIVLGWRRRLVMAGMATQAFLFIFLAVSLLVSVRQDPTQRTAYVGVVTYIGLGIMCVTKWQTGHEMRPGTR